jgi:large subunit ribosomal protein L20
MVRVKRGNVARKRRKKILQLAKGYRGAHSRLFRVANQQVMKALRYSYVGRKQKKRFFRKLWIMRIKSSLDWQVNLNLKYNQLINLFKNVNFGYNRKTLSDLLALDLYDIAKLAMLRAVAKYKKEVNKILLDINPKKHLINEENSANTLIRKNLIKQVLVRKLLTQKTISKPLVLNFLEELKVRPNGFQIIERRAFNKLKELKLRLAYIWVRNCLCSFFNIYSIVYHVYNRPSNMEIENNSEEI